MLDYRYRDRQSPIDKALAQFSQRLVRSMALQGRCQTCQILDDDDDDGDDGDAGSSKPQLLLSRRNPNWTRPHVARDRIGWKVAQIIRKCISHQTFVHFT